MNTRIAIVVVAIMLHAVPGSAAPVQWSQNGHWYEHVSERLNWSDALASAATRSYQGLPGYLATVASAQENDLIRSLLNDAEWGAWLAGSDAAVEGEWRWMAGPETGTLFWLGNASGHAPAGAYENWAPFEPNNTNVENAVAIWGPHGASGPNDWGLWNDFQATDTQGFVVEYSVPEPNTVLLLLPVMVVWMGGNRLRVLLVARQRSSARAASRNSESTR